MEDKLEVMYKDKINGHKIRSRAKWYEEGEKNTSYFLGLERSRQAKKVITELKDENGATTTDQNKILQIEVNYYRKLYDSSNPYEEEVKNYIKDTCINKKLNDNESIVCEGKVTVSECTDAIFKMKLNKAPGLDGLTVEFYRKFWHNIKNLIVRVFNNSFEKHELTNSQKKGAISLIYKKK